MLRARAEADSLAARGCTAEPAAHPPTSALLTSKLRAAKAAAAAAAKGPAAKEVRPRPAKAAGSPVEAAGASPEPAKAAEHLQQRRRPTRPQHSSLRIPGPGSGPGLGSDPGLGSGLSPAVPPPTSAKMSSAARGW